MKFQRLPDGIFFTICLLFIFLITTVQAGEDSDTLSKQSNLHAMQRTVHLMTADIIDRSHFAVNDSVVVRFSTTENAWIAQDPMLAALKAFGCVVFSRNDSSGTNSGFIIQNDGVDFRVQYSDMFHDGFLGTKKMKRTVAVQFSSKTIRAQTGEVVQSGMVMRETSDTVNVDDVTKLEAEGIRVTHGEIPQGSFFDKVLEPFVIIGATGVVVYLFFQVRG